MKYLFPFPKMPIHLFMHLNPCSVICSFNFSFWYFRLFFGYVMNWICFGANALVKWGNILDCNDLFTVCLHELQIPGLVNVDFADVRAIMANAGSSLMGIGTATGKFRMLFCWWSGPLLYVGYHLIHNFMYMWDD